MTPEAAEAFAESVHAGARDRYGSLLVDHVRRVAIAVPAEARAVAWLHEALEYAAVSEEDLRAAGASDGQVGALTLLTRDLSGDEAAYLAHIERIASAPGESGRLARIVKRVDLVDRATHQAPRSGAPPPPPYREALDILSRYDPPATYDPRELEASAGTPAERAAQSRARPRRAAPRNIPVIE